jgi:PIN domain nuclease of toxin-antitoxin system
MPCQPRSWKPGSNDLQLLLDTHAFLWWLAGDDALSTAAKTAIVDEGNDIFVSAASAWEITTKHRIGKLPGVAAIVGNLDKAVADQGFIGLPINLRHGQVAGGLPGPHRDPFDRMLIAQAMLENLVLVSNERPFDAYDVGRLW